MISARYSAVIRFALVAVAFAPVRALADDPPKLSLYCPVSPEELIDSFTPGTKAAGLRPIIENWMDGAMDVAPRAQRSAYERALRNSVGALRQAGVSTTRDELLAFRYTTLRAWRVDATPPFLAGEGPYKSADDMDAELALILTMLPAACGGT